MQLAACHGVTDAPECHRGAGSLGGGGRCTRRPACRACVDPLRIDRHVVIRELFQPGHDSDFAAIQHPTQNRDVDQERCSGLGVT
ncbi:MAG: hypothetical protein U0Q03_22875 [Acidimicrobiales bacterium]